MDILFAFLAGMTASFINTFAGGGSLITLPVLFFLGLPAPVANGTNKIGLLAGNLTNTVNYGRKKIIPWKEMLFVLPFGIAGAISGSLFSITLSEKTYRLLLSAVMILVLVLILLQPQKKIRTRDNLPPRWEKMITALMFLCIGFYGGFIQAGMGYLAIIALTLFGDRDLLQISAFKATVGFAVVFFSVIVFVIKGLIDWPVALALSAGQILGALIGSSLAMKKGERFMRPILAVIVFAMAVRLSGIVDWIIGLIKGV